MNISKAFTQCRFLASRGTLVVKKHSPEILTTVGVVGVVTSAVLASKATLKLNDSLDELKEDIRVIDLSQKAGTRDLSDEDYMKLRVLAHTKNAGRIAKLYGPSVTLGLASIGCILAAHGIMKKRNAALAAAYKGAESALAEYKKRMEEAFGEEEVQKAASGLRAVDEDESKEWDPSDSLKVSQYARFFDETNIRWKKDAEYNLQFLKMQQNYFNDRLNAHGHVFLNEVYDALGFERTKAGQIVGWVRNGADGYIDFNIYDFQSEDARAFVNTEERSILLDFNVDGNIYDLI